MTERIGMTLETDLGRSRPLVLLRVPLAVAPALALGLWTALAVVGLSVAWPVAVVRGEVPIVLHRFERRYVRDATRFVAWLTLVTERGAVSLDAPRLRQHRLSVALRPLLALPGVVLASVLAVALAWCAVGAWFVALARGRTTSGLRELGAFCVRYLAETLAYLLLVSPSAPQLAPPATEGR